MKLQGRLYEETLPSAGATRKHLVQKFSDDGYMNNTPEFVVPADSVFAMGDNRDNSSDSRDPTGGVGFVPLVNLVGRAEFIFFSVNGTAPIWQIWEWPFEIRWSRLLHGIT